MVTIVFSGSEAVEEVLRLAVVLFWNGAPEVSEVVTTLPEGAEVVTLVLMGSIGEDCETVLEVAFPEGAVDSDEVETAVPVEIMDDSVEDWVVELANGALDSLVETTTEPVPVSRDEVETAVPVEMMDDSVEDLVVELANGALDSLVEITTEPVPVSWDEVETAVPVEIIDGSVVD